VTSVSTNVHATVTFSFAATRLDDGRVLLVDAGLDEVAVAAIARRLPNAGDGPGPWQLEVEDAPGELRTIEVSSVAVSDKAASSLPNHSLVARDVSDEVRRQREDIAATAGVLAHDLRNPLAGIQGWIEPVREGLEEGDLQLVHGFLDRVTATVSRMNALLDRILLYATDSDAELVTAVVDLDEVVDEVVTTLSVPDVVRHETLPKVDADPVLIRQVLDNLIKNSLKYVVPGDRPRVEIFGKIRDDGEVAISVADRGIGIPAADREAVFDIYRRMHHGVEGTGLGLAICRRILARHRGTIVAAANPAGSGTVITFTLPPR
jgi:signal transduction histidine kinase